MLCKKCKKKTEPMDLYCLECGTPTESYKEHFNVRSLLKKSSEETNTYKPNFHFFYIIVMLVILLFIGLAHFQVFSEKALFNYIYLNVSMILVIPFLLLPFGTISEYRNEPAKLSDTFKFYPKLMLLILCLSIYFAVLKIICQGDPILNLVRLILVLWGLAIVFPVVFLIFNRNSEPQMDTLTIFRLIKKAYIAGKYLRWHQFSLCLILGVINLISVVLIFVPLPAAMNFTGNTMYLWFKKQEEFGLYDKHKDY